MCGIYGGSRDTLKGLNNRFLTLRCAAVRNDCVVEVVGEITAEWRDLGGCVKQQIPHAPLRGGLE